jgi:hypothetical protein
MFFDDHNPPHFHVYYQSHAAIIEINTLTLIGGSLPPRALGLAIEWASLHTDELNECWERARRNQSLFRIDPLP